MALQPAQATVVALAVASPRPFSMVLILVTSSALLLVSRPCSITCGGLQRTYRAGDVLEIESGG